MISLVKILILGGFGRVGTLAVSVTRGPVKQPTLTDSPGYLVGLRSVALCLFLPVLTFVLRSLGTSCSFGNFL